MTDPRATDETRIDRWLCAVRLVKIRPIASRVAAPVAAACSVDLSPPVVAEAGPEIKLIRGEGRPSKRRRRDFERLRRAADA